MTRAPRWLAAVALLAAWAPAVRAQGAREAALGLRFEPLMFQPPDPELHVLSNGVRVLYLADRTLPLVDVYARFRGGFSDFPRAYYAAATALPSLMRSGGTATLPQDSLDALLELHAIVTSVGNDGESSFASLNTLTRHLDIALDLLGGVLKTPRFESAMVEVWRGQELENVRRRADDPGVLAFSEFNRLMFGDHPIGWEMETADLEPGDLAHERLEWVHRRVFCRENMILGVTGDVSWPELAPRLERLVANWPPCPEPIQRAPAPVMRTEPGIFLIARPLEQSTVVMAHVADVRQADTREFYASRIGNSILGGGGLSSRLMTRLRTERGYAYSASSLWTTPRSHAGLVGAVTGTKSETTVAAVRLILSSLQEMTAQPPSADEVARSVDATVNGFVFNFKTNAQIVARKMAFLAVGMPDDWLELYLAGIQRVTPEQIQEVFIRHVHPEQMVILVVGDPERIGEPLDRLGPVTELSTDRAEPTR